MELDFSCADRGPECADVHAVTFLVEDNLDDRSVIDRKFSEAFLKSERRRHLAEVVHACRCAFSDGSEQTSMDGWLTDHTEVLAICRPIIRT